MVVTFLFLQYHAETLQLEPHADTSVETLVINRLLQECNSANLLLPSTLCTVYR